MPRNQKFFEIDKRRVTRLLTRRVKEGRVQISPHLDPPLENGSTFDWERTNWLRIGTPLILSLPFWGLWLTFPLITIFLYAALFCIIPSLLSLWSKRTTKIMFHIEGSERFELLPDDTKKLLGNRALSPEEEGEFIDRRTAKIKLPRQGGQSTTFLNIMTVINFLLILAILYGFHLGR